jgi:hypothetical protein
MSRLAVVLLLLFLGLSAAHAQNKCVDGKGKVTYQQDPCPGQAAAPRPAAAPAATPTPAPKPAARSEDAMWRELSELQKCKGDWETVAASVSRSRKEAASLRAQGEDSSREEQIRQQYVAETMARFLPSCSRHGFEYPRDLPDEQRNSAAAQALTQKIEAMRLELDAASRLATKERAAAGGAVETPRPSYKECAHMAKDIARSRAALWKVDPAARPAREQAIENNQSAYERNCSR